MAESDRSRDLPGRAEAAPKQPPRETVVEGRKKDAGQDAGLFETAIGDGRPLLILSGASLVFAGGFAIFLAAAGLLLPHDVDFLGMTTEHLCRLRGCRVVHFMIHDRVAFGGALIAIGSVYMWLAAFPLRRGEPWAWWLFVMSGIVGFGSFLTYLGYGYLDTWHGFGTVLLLPVFIFGLIRTRRLLRGNKGIGSLVRTDVEPRWRSRFGAGRGLMLAAAAGFTVGGFVIMGVGVTDVFVPQDLSFIGMTESELDAVNPNLVPLMAHDRAGFGGAVCTAGLLMLFCVWRAQPSRSLWQILAVAGVVGFAGAIGIHPVVGYNDLVHIGPAVLGAVVFLVGLLLASRPAASE